MAKNRKIRAIIDNIESYTSEDLLTSETLRELIYKEVPDSIEEAIKSNSSYATLFEINSTGYCVELHKKDWIKALEVCLEENVTKEEYKQCTRINDIIIKLQKKQTKAKSNGTV